MTRLMKTVLAFLLLAACATAPSMPLMAANCAVFPYTLTNGTTADANQVMSNFNTLMTCSNSNLAHNAANTDITSVLLNNGGLTVKDIGGTQSLALKPGSTLTAPRILTLTTGDANRTLSLGGDLTTAAALTTAGANALTLTTTGATNVTLPTSGTLATYSTGSATPTLAFGGGSVGITYSGQAFNYTIIGNQVFWWLNISLTSKGSSVGAATVTVTLPQTPLDAQQYIVKTQNITLDGGFSNTYVPIVGSGFTFREFGSGIGTQALQDTNFSNTSQINVSGAYRF